ncbi:Cysteine-rich receptor-like protein kinase 10 [Hibiscus syriacus]|uniref:Cysteine-rich receptor-like protein kinase 10 n=1 Tax=Hibiscus syriacus TaxID=106335 RepID=A0A6A3BVF0_HIBSY|nr:Cysteine-rich receptor-like protein kinase 10 [Hibiscus syriacus]
MAANKFATTLHKNTNRIGFILVYVLLEWILIVLLLLNSVFSYLIIKFADYFGLKRPCLWCSRLNHVFEPSKYKNSCRDLVCDDHANQISKLVFCSNHRRLSESRDMCGDCLSSSSPEVMEYGDENFKCSYCDVVLEKKWNLPYFMIKPSWEVLDNPQEGNFIAESGEKVDKGNASDGIRSGFVADDQEDEQRIEENKGVGIISDGDEGRGMEKDEFSCFISSFDCNQVAADGDDVAIEKDQESVEGDLILSMENQGLMEPPEILAKHLEFYIEGDDCHLIPVELMNSDADFREEDQGVSDNEDVIFDFDSLSPAPVELAMENSCSPAEEVTPLSTNETENENETSIAELAVVESMESNEEEDDDDDVQANAATTEGEINVDTNQGSNDAEEEPTQFKTAPVETSDQAMKNHLSLSSDLYEIEEDKVPDMPTSIESFHLLHKKLLLLDRRDSGTEDSIDGSVFGDIEGADGVLTVEKLKSALKTERKALNALYTELEEERSASAVATSQTMAMITRIQEEKAAMQMEALQYQRMMEEQSEYDQEALQLLNELMVKREKEKAELEKELEIYRRKVLDYEAKESTLTPRRRKNDSTQSTSSASCCNAENSDGVSIDLNHESKGEDSFEKHRIREDVNRNTPASAVLYLEESLACFEEERVSILEQLKVLEEKLVSLNDEEAEQHFEYFYDENGSGFHQSPDFGHETNGVANGHFKGAHGKHQEDKVIPMAANAKRLVPHFDASDADIEDKTSNRPENGFHSVSLRRSSPELESKTLPIKEEVDDAYERLQALEADREFIKHCTSSLNKGDKGVCLLQQILQHLRDLRSVELRVRSIEDAAI